LRAGTIAAMSTLAERPRRITDLPGPRGWPLVGNLLQIDRQRLHQHLEQWAEQYGEIYRIRLATRNFVIVSNPEAVAAALRDRPDGFDRTPRLEKIAAEFGFGGVFSSNGAAWKRQRPMVLAGLDPSHIRAFFPTLVQVTARLARRWQRNAGAATPIDLQADLMRYTVDVTAGLALGTDINSLESSGPVIQQHLDHILPALARRLYAPFPYWRYLKLPGDRSIDRHVAALRVAVTGFIADARRRLEAEPARREQPPTLIESMVATRDRDGALTDQDVAGNVLTMLLAGEDTTANTLAWMIWLLHRHPDALRRATDEVRAALGADAVPQRLEQLADLPFVEACAHETMRLKPVGPFIVLQSLRDTELAGVAIPAGTLLMCLLRPAAVDPARFADPQQFAPARWLGGAGPGQAGASAKRVAMPFGAGPRICPGRYLALIEIKMAIAMLLAGFEIEDVRTPDGEPVREIMAFTMSPSDLTMRLRPRDAVAAA
jgi:cytochrome P450